MPFASVNIEGLGKLRKGLRELDPALAKELRGSFLDVATHVATDARSQVPRRSGRAAGSIRPGVAGNVAYVAGGKKSVPYYGWLDFGGGIPNKAHRGSNPPRIRRPYMKKGRYLYPAIARNAVYIVRRSVEAVNNASRKAFPR